MCDRNETCRPGGTGVTPEAFWDVYELAVADQRDGDGQGDEENLADRYGFSKEQLDGVMENFRTKERE